MVSIMPGMDIAEPERTETSNGFCASPKSLPVLVSITFIWAWIVSSNSFGSPLRGVAR